MFYGNSLAALSFLLGFVSGAVYLHSRGVFLRDQLGDFDASRAQISLVFSAATAAGAAFAPVLGYLLDRHPIRRVMSAGAVWMGAGFLALSQASTLVQFGIMMALFVGLGTGTIGTTASSKLMVSWFERRRGLALSVAITGYAVAGIIMPPLAVRMLDVLGWRSSYLLFGAVLLLFVLPLVASMVREPPRSIAPATTTGRFPRRAALSVYHDFARSRTFWACALFFGLMAAVLGGLSLHLFLHFTDRGLGDLEAASILSLEGACALASKPLVGWSIDRWGARRSALVALSGCALALVVLVKADAYLPALGAGALVGLAFGGVIPLQAAFLVQEFGVERFARAYGSLRLVTFPLTVGCPLLVGYAHDLTGRYSAAFAIFALLFAAALVVAWRLRPVRASPSVAR